MRRKSENAARQRGKAVVDERRMNDGTLERAEMDRLRNRAKRSVKSGDSRASAKRAALNTRAATHANAGDATGTVRSAGEAAIDATIAIIATTIDAVTPTGDRDATDATDATTSQYAETATAEASAERDATATDATRRDATAGKKPWSPSATKKGTRRSRSTRVARPTQGRIASSRCASHEQRRRELRRP